MQGKPEKTMIPHLIGCAKVSPDIRDKAKDAKNKVNIENAPPTGLRTSITPSVSRAGTPALSWPPPSSNLASITPDLLGAPGDSRPVKRLCSEEWTANQQQEFSEDLLKVFISAGIPWNAASDPEMNLFFNKWVPGSKMPDRRVLSGRLLDKEAAEAESRMKKRMVGKVATGQCDGWKNVARASVVATMATVEGEVSLLFSYTGRQWQYV
jgi:hypothetical protein